MSQALQTSSKEIGTSWRKNTGQSSSYVFLMILYEKRFISETVVSKCQIASEIHKIERQVDTGEYMRKCLIFNTSDFLNTERGALENG